MLEALLVFYPNRAHIMLVFKNSATFFQYYPRQKVAKTIRKVSFTNLLYYYYYNLLP